MLGSSLIRTLSASYDVYATYNKHEIAEECKKLKIDLLEKKRLAELVKEIRPELVIHTAALTDMNYCEENPDEAYRQNVAVTENVAEACKLSNSSAAYISTDYMFDGKKDGSYTEEDIPKPLSIYSKTKLEGEKIIKEVDCLILRTFIYGWSPQQKKSFAEWIIDEISNKREIRAFTDQKFTPIFTDHFSRLLIELYVKNKRGLFNVATDKSITRHEFAMKLAEIFRLDKSLIKDGLLADHKQKAPRPKNSSLDNSKLKMELKITEISYIKDLEEMLKKQRQ